MHNLNDNRFPISVNDVFDKRGEFLKDGQDNEIGKELLIQKLTGYVSYVAGENPFRFPYRIWPMEYNNPHSLRKLLSDGNWNYPTTQVNTMEVSQPIEYLDLVSLGTVCDVVPLVGLNIAIVKQGLKVIKLKKNLGLKTLLDICKIESNPSIYHLGYLLGPRINAGGRVGKSSHGANLLLNKDPKSSFQLASELDQYNKERQLLEKDLLQSILNKTLIV